MNERDLAFKAAVLDNLLGRVNYPAAVDAVNVLCPRLERCLKVKEQVHVQVLKGQGAGALLVWILRTSAQQEKWQHSDVALSQKDLGGKHGEKAGAAANIEDNLVLEEVLVVDHRVAVRVGAHAILQCGNKGLGSGAWALCKYFPAMMTGKGVHRAAGCGNNLAKGGARKVPHGSLSLPSSLPPFLPSSIPPPLPPTHPPSLSPSLWD